jgi:hypothetical protein
MITNKFKGPFKRLRSLQVDHIKHFPQALFHDFSHASFINKNPAINSQLYQLNITYSREAKAFFSSSSQ